MYLQKCLEGLGHGTVIDDLNFCVKSNISHGIPASKYTPQKAPNGENDRNVFPFRCPFI
jgi:hypothetical protein